jgi:hypothetical protein
MIRWIAAPGRSKFGLLIMIMFLQAMTASGDMLPDAGQLQSARNEAELIDLELSDMTIARRPLDGISAEGATVLGYRPQDAADTTVRKIVLEAFGETGQQRSAYYFRNGKLFYAIETMFTYDKPLDLETGAPARSLAEINRVAMEDGKIIARDSKKTALGDKCLKYESRRLNALGKSLMLLLDTPENENAGACGWTCTQGELPACTRFECLD